MTTAENGSYTECIQNVYSLDTQISIDKIRLDKNSISSSIEQFETDTATEKNIFDYYPSQAKILNYIFSRKNPMILNKNRKERTS